MLKPLVLLVTLLLAPFPALAQSNAETDASIATVLGDPPAYREAFDAVQAAVRDDDAEAFASWVNYPIEVVADGETMTIGSPEQFAEHYSNIVTEEIGLTITEQGWDDLFVNQDGIMFGNGELWMNGICKDETCSAFDVRVITIQSTAL